MLVRLLFGVASVVAVVGTLWGSVAPVRACTGDSLELYVQRANLLVEGRIVSWERAGDVDTPSWGNTPLRLRVEVERTLKGEHTGEVSFVDIWSLDQRAGTDRWDASPGGCPAPFNEDPTGKMAVLGLDWNAHDGYHTGRVAYIGYSLSGDRYQQTISTIAAELPAGGGPPGSATFPYSPVAIAATIGPLAFLAGAAFLWRRRV